MTDAVAARIAQIFNGEFLSSHHTLMCGGAAEPIGSNINTLARANEINSNLKRNEIIRFESAS